VQRTFVSELSPTEYRASMLGAFQMIVGLCALPASVIAGLLWTSFGKFAPFYFSLGLTILATALILFVKERAQLLERQYPIDCQKREGEVLPLLAP